MGKSIVMWVPVGTIPLGLKQQLPALSYLLPSVVAGNFLLNGQFLSPHVKSFLHSVSDIQIPSPISQGEFVVQFLLTNVGTVPIKKILCYKLEQLQWVQL